jgi:ABC-type glycerol-3-phosphate transport system permease component
MKTNVGKVDKVLRIIVALVAAYFAWKGDVTETMRYVLWAVAVIMMITALAGTCPLYSIFGINTCKIKEEK